MVQEHIVPVLTIPSTMPSYVANSDTTIATEDGWSGFFFFPRRVLVLVHHHHHHHLLHLVVVVVAKDERNTVDQQIDKFLNVLNGPYTMLKPFQRHQTIAVHHQKREE